MLSPFKIKNRLDMQNITPTEICKRLIRLSGLDLFNNTRKRPYVEVRALACFLMREKLNMRLCAIAKFFNENGKHFGHDTVIYMVNNYPYYKKANSTLEDWEMCFTFINGLDYEEVDRIRVVQNKLTILQNKYDKLTEKLESPLIKAVYNVTDRKQMWELADKIALIKKSWEWKNK